MIVCLFIIIVLHPPEFECIDLPLGTRNFKRRFVAQAQPSAAEECRDGQFSPTNCLMLAGQA